MIIEQLDKDELEVLGTHTFSNESIRFACKDEMDGHDIPNKEMAFYSPEFSQVSQKKITSILKSKFKAQSKLYHIKDQVLRCMKFEQDDTKFVTDATGVTLSREVNTDLQDNLESKRIVNEPKII
jgi:hypothetical protein